jgi:hypothetical protein
MLVGLAILIALAPLAFWLAERVPSGPAWGEWGPDEIGAREKYVPKGLERLSSLWNAPLTDYGAESGNRGLAYFLSGLSGALATAGAAWLLTRRLAGKK